jgi:hypothetical protein
LANQVHPERVVWFLGRQFEATGDVDASRRLERVVRPQPYSAVAGLPRKREAGIDQPAAQAVPARIRVHEEDAELGDLSIGGIGDAEDAADSPPVQLGDPSRLALGVVAVGVVGHDARHERLELGIPAELGLIQLAVRHHHPAEIARLAKLADDRLPCRAHRECSYALKRLFQ